ncbi:MAG: ATP-binding protein [Cellvibrio sp.]|uniref:ATP-binding protein n=1 Tax=Cellvibrio sp. TaxID=1965322 RepID=UPI00271C43C6|nr:ATP-binding protein [Cellvibrio sp.]
MIKRHIEPEFLQLLGEYPIVTILGPRQAGKTTLARQLLPDYAYVNLEHPETRNFALDDPKAFLAQYPGKVIFDEIQRLPELLSYLQVAVDNQRENGRYVLTGSHQLALREAIAQSLAGRTAILHLLPFSIAELVDNDLGFVKAEDYIYQGFLPRIYDQQQRPSTAYANYYQTYVERDVRQLINLKDVAQFQKFMKLVAGRVGQLMDYSSLAGDVGVSATTIKHWLSILEASFILYKLPPYFENFGKRVIKTPKYYFIDTGLLCFLLGIENPAQVTRDPLIGQLFENLVVIDVLKNFYNKGKLDNLYFFRDSNGLEADLLLQQGRQLMPIEIKSSSTYKPELLKGLKRILELSPLMFNAHLVYAGDAMEFSNGINAIRFDELASRL